MRVLAPAPKALARRPDEEPVELTVAIAAYQAEKTVMAAAISALSQDPPPAHVIVVDDGSSDATADVAESLAPSVQVIRRAHAGEAATKNAAARVAATSVLGYLDADDVLLPGWTAAVTRVLEERPDVDLVCTDAWLIREGRQVRRAYDPTFAFAVRDQRRELLRRNFVLGLCAVRRRALLAGGGFDERVETASDWSAWLRLVLEGGVLACVDEPLAEYRLHDSSMSANRIRLLRGRVAVLEAISDHPGLTVGDREVLSASLEAQRAALVRATTREALLSDDTGARRRSLQLALDRGQAAATRRKALAAAVLPRVLMRRALERDELNGGFRGGVN